MKLSDTQKWVFAATLLASLVLIYALRPILSPFLVGALLAYLGDPIADRLEALGLKRTTAVIIVFTVFTSFFAVLLLITVPMIGRQFDILITQFPKWIDLIQYQLIPYILSFLNLSPDIINFDLIKKVIAENWETAGGFLSKIWPKLAGSSLAFMTMLMNLLLIPVVSFYLLRDWDILVAKVRDLLPRFWEDRISQVMLECDEIIGAFIRGQLLVMFSQAVIYSIGLSIVGLELALILGIVAGLASIVPYLGTIIGIGSACAAAYFQFNDFMPLIYVLIVFGVGQMLEQMVLTPLLVGDKIGLHPVAVIFAVMAGGQLAGFTGVLLALPVAAILMVWLRHIHTDYKESLLYKGGMEPVIVSGEVSSDDSAVASDETVEREEQVDSQTAKNDKHEPRV